MSGTADAKDQSGIVTAGLLVIGDEILSGRTKDKNIGFIAEYLTAIGIDLKEVRVVPGRRAGNRRRVECAAVALHLCLHHRWDRADPRRHHCRRRGQSIRRCHRLPPAGGRYSARAACADRRGDERSAHAHTCVPAGGELVLNKISAAPGFRIGNVIVMAGIPSVMQAMLEYVTPQLETGAKMLSESVQADCREGDIGTELGVIAKAHPEVIIGSYPFMDEKRGANAQVVMRARDPQKLAAAKAEVEAMLARVHAQLATG